MKTAGEHAKLIVCTNSEMLCQGELGDLGPVIDTDEWDNHDAREALCASYIGFLIEALSDAGFDPEPARGDLSTYHGWNGYQFFKWTSVSVGSHEELTEAQSNAIFEAYELAMERFQLDTNCHPSQRSKAVAEAIANAPYRGAIFEAVPGEVFGACANWNQASAPVHTFGPDGWSQSGRQVAEYRHSAIEAIREQIEETEGASFWITDFFGE